MITGADAAADDVAAERLGSVNAQLHADLQSGSHHKALGAGDDLNRLAKRLGDLRHNGADDGRRDIGGVDRVDLEEGVEFHRQLVAGLAGVGGKPQLEIEPVVFVDTQLDIGIAYVGSQQHNQRSHQLIVFTSIIITQNLSVSRCLLGIL